MQKDERKSKKEIERARKENAEIAFEKLKTKNIKELKTLDQLMKEKP